MRHCWDWLALSIGVSNSDVAMQCGFIHLPSVKGNTPPQYMAVTRGATVCEMLTIIQCVLYNHSGTIGFMPENRDSLLSQSISQSYTYPFTFCLQCQSAFSAAQRCFRSEGRRFGRNGGHYGKRCLCRSRKLCSKKLQFLPNAYLDPILRGLSQNANSVLNFKLKSFECAVESVLIATDRVSSSQYLVDIESLSYLCDTGMLRLELI